MPKLSFPRGTHGNSSLKAVELVTARWHRDHVIDAPSAGLGQRADYSNYLRGQMPKLSFPRKMHGSSSLKTVELVTARWHRDHVIDAPSAGLEQRADYSNNLRGQMPKLFPVLNTWQLVSQGCEAGNGAMAQRPRHRRPIRSPGTAGRLLQQPKRPDALCS